MVTLKHIRELEEKLSYASPKEYGRLVKRIAKLKSEFVRQ